MRGALTLSAWLWALLAPPLLILRSTFHCLFLLPQPPYLRLADQHSLELLLHLVLGLRALSVGRADRSLFGALGCFASGWLLPVFVFPRLCLTHLCSRDLLPV